MKTLRELILRVATAAAVWMAVSAAWPVLRPPIPAVFVPNNGCIFHKPPSRWTKDDVDELELRIRRIEEMPEGKGATHP